MTFAAQSSRHVLLGARPVSRHAATRRRSAAASARASYAGYGNSGYTSQAQVQSQPQKDFWGYDIPSANTHEEEEQHYSWAQDGHADAGSYSEGGEEYYDERYEEDDSYAREDQAHWEHERVAAASSGAPQREDVVNAVANNPLFNSQFMGVLQNSLARQGVESLTSAPPSEPRSSATEEVLTAALGQSKQTLQQLYVWREQIERQIQAQQKQVDRLSFSLNKAKSDAAYMQVLKEMMHGDM